MPPSGILHTEAIVIRTIDYSETSRIVTLFTREEGKMGVMAKGARAAKSRFGSTLEPMSRIAAIIHCRPGRDLQILSEASHVAHLPTLRMELDRMESAFRMIELVGGVASRWTGERRCVWSSYGVPHCARWNAGSCFECVAFFPDSSGYNSWFWAILRWQYREINGSGVRHFGSAFWTHRPSKS